MEKNNRISDLAGEFGEGAMAIGGKVSEHSILVNGRNVHYVLYGTGDKKIIGLHGWPGGCTDFLSIFQAIPTGFQMIVPDLPGCGQSEKLSVKHTVSVFSEFLKDFADSLGFDKFVISAICGTSPVAIKFSSLYPERVEGLVFHYFPYIYPKVISLKSGIPVMARVARFEPGLWLLDKVRKNDRIMGKFLVQGLPEDARKTAKIDIENKKKAYLRGAVEFVRSIMHTDLRHEWGSLGIPTLIIAAGEDHTISMKNALPLCEGRKNVELVILEKAKHYWDREFKKRQNEEVKKFLVSISGIN